MTPGRGDAPSVIPVGRFRCYPIADGDRLYPKALLAGDDPERVVALPEEVSVPYTPLLVDSGSDRILIDTGAGPLADTTGRLERSLDRAGFKPADINAVVLSHAHPDHIGGLSLEDGTPRFPNARVLMSRKEYDFWHSVELRDKLGTGFVYGDAHLEQVIAMWINRYLPPVRERLEWLSGETEITPGVLVMDAPGHTPGHVAITISSGAESLLYAGDLMVVEGQAANPEWTTIFDLDALGIVRTRRRLFDRASADRSIVFHYHFGKVGRLERNGSQFQWEQL